MEIVEIKTLENGAHNNQTINGVTPATFPIPEGWALFPEGIGHENFPFGTVTVEEVEGVLTVTSWTPGEIPPAPEPEPVPTEFDRMEAQIAYTAMMTGTLLEV